MKRTEIGGTYWYGWSMMLPEDFDFSGSANHCHAIGYMAFSPKWKIPTPVQMDHA